MNRNRLHFMAAAFAASLFSSAGCSTSSGEEAAFINAAFRLVPENGSGAADDGAEAEIALTSAVGGLETEAEVLSVSKTTENGVVVFTEDDAVTVIGENKTPQGRTLLPGRYDLRVVNLTSGWEVAFAPPAVSIVDSVATETMIVVRRTVELPTPPCDPWVTDCNGDEVTPDLTIPEDPPPPCDPWLQDCDGDGTAPDLTIPEPACDPATADCDGDGTIDCAEPEAGCYPENPDPCDPWVSDCNGDGIAPDLTVPEDPPPPCDPWAEDCNEDGVSPDLAIPDPPCDPWVADCDGDGVAPDLAIPDPPCDGWVEDCDGDGVIDEEEAGGALDPLRRWGILTVEARAETEDGDILAGVAVELSRFGLAGVTGDDGRITFAGIPLDVPFDVEARDLAVPPAFSSSELTGVVVTSREPVLQAVVMYPAVSGGVFAGTAWPRGCVGGTNPPPFLAGGIWVTGVGVVPADDPEVSCRSETPEILSVGGEGFHPCAQHFLTEGMGYVVVLYGGRESEPIAVPSAACP